MANGMTAMVKTGGKDCVVQNVTGRPPPVLGCIISSTGNFITKRIKMHTKAMIIYTKPITIGQNLTNYKHHAWNKTKKLTKGLLGPCKPCTKFGCHGQHNKSMVPTLSHTREKIKLSRRNKPDLCKLMVFMWRLMWYVINSMLVKQLTHFLKKGQRTELLGINKKKMTASNRSCRRTVSCYCE